MYRSQVRSAATLLWGTLAALLLIAGGISAWASGGVDTSTSSTEDSTGLVTAVNGSSISLHSRRGPFTYRLGPDLHVIGAKNQRLKVADLHAGQKATIYYYLRDGEQIAARIVVLADENGHKGR